MSQVTCSQCGAPLPIEPPATSEASPCPHCGGIDPTINGSIAELLTISDKVGAELMPGNQDRDWRRRWMLIQNDIQVVTSSNTEVMSSDSIHASHQRLESFFILAYHLKDDLIIAASGLGLDPKNDIEQAINNEPRLALLADVANTAKHTTLCRLRSGCQPLVEQISGADDPTGNGWRLGVKIKHGASVLDGLDIAEDAVTAWREQLAAWGLI